MCSQRVVLRLGERAGSAQSREAILEDISATGACVQLVEPVPVGGPGELVVSKKRLRGTIRYCEFREIGYFVGIEFEPGAKWSHDDFVPEHLLDPRDLMGDRRKRNESAVRASYHHQSPRPRTLTEEAKVGYGTENRSAWCSGGAKDNVLAPEAPSDTTASLPDATRAE